VATKRSSEEFSSNRDCAFAFGKTPQAIAPTAQFSSGERQIMRTTTKRTLIAAAALTAAGLFGSLPYHGSVQADGVPVQQHDVALVDLTSDILGPETTFDTGFYNSVLGPTGAEEQLLSSFQAAYGDATAAYLLDTNTASPDFSGVFNGAESRFFEGAFLDTLASEDSINQLFGITSADSQQALLDVFTSTGGPPIPAAADVTLAQLEGAVGTPAFDTDLTAIANADFASGLTDLQGYLGDLVSGAGGTGLSGLPGDLGGGDLSGLLSGLLGDLGLGSVGDGVGGLGGDLTSVLDGLLGLL
jgi:hypothetical protein